MKTLPERSQAALAAIDRSPPSLVGTWTIDPSDSGVSFAWRTPRRGVVTGRLHCWGVVHLDDLPPVGVIQFEQPSGLPVLTMALDPASVELTDVMGHRWWTLRSESLEVLAAGTWRVMATLIANGTQSWSSCISRSIPGQAAPTGWCCGEAECWIDVSLASATRPRSWTAGSSSTWQCVPDEWKTEGGLAMQRHRTRVLTTIAAAAAAAALTAAGMISMPARATPPSPEVSTTILARSTFDRIHVKAHADTADRWRALLKTHGQSDVYVVDNKLPPGATTGWHSHPGPSLILVVAGSVTNYPGHDPKCRPQVYSAGAGFIDPGGGDVHMLRNETDAVAETIAVQLLPKDAVRRIDAPAPTNCPA
jgi:quercetin dioxygenase-like cupin family protein